MNTPTTPSRLELATILTAGLLASGHYTEPGDADEAAPEVIEIDNTYDWKKFGFVSRTRPAVIGDAVWLLMRLEQAIEHTFGTQPVAEAPSPIGNAFGMIVRNEPEIAKSIDAAIAGSGPDPNRTFAEALKVKPGSAVMTPGGGQNAPQTPS